jgi:sugar lactone lactonase YvrE
MRGVVPLTVLALAAALLGAGPAAAMVPCAGAVRAHALADGQGVLESVISGPDGRLYFTATPPDEGGRLMVLPRRGSNPRVVSSPIESPGGLAVDQGGRILVGFGNGIVPGAIGTVSPTAGLFRVDPRTSRRTVFARGLSMANGIARAADGTVYASQDAGTSIDRIRNGRVDVGWIRTTFPNGLVISRDQRYLYWAQTFQPPQISRAPLDHPGRAEVFARGGLEDLTAALDGMTRDARDRLFVAANFNGEVWRVDRRGRPCLVTSGLSQPSAVAFGSGRRGFSRRNLYVVEFSGRLREIKNARGARFPE